MNRLATFIATTTLTIAGYVVFGTVSAHAATLVWTGSAGDSKITTAANWNPNQQPADGDSLIFNDSHMVGEKTLNFDTNAVFSSVDIRAAESSTVTVGGSLVTQDLVTRGLGMVVIDMDALRLVGGNSEPIIRVNNPMLIIDVGTIYTVNSNELIIDGHGILELARGEFKDGVTEIIRMKNNIHVVSDVQLTDYVDIMDYSRLTVNLVYSSHRIGGSDGWIRPHSNATLEFYIDGDTTLPDKIYFPEGTTTIKAYNINDEVNILTLSGVINFGEGNPTYIGDNVDLRITAQLNAAEGRKIDLAPGSTGNLIVDVSNNNSAMPNGVTRPAVKTEVLEDANQADISIYKNNIVIIKGSRGSVAVYDGGLLKGTGMAGVLTVYSGGRVAPGESPGIINAEDVEFHAGSFLEIEIGGNAVGTQYDQLKVLGPVSLGNATLETKFLNGFKPKPGDVFTIIDNDGSDAVTGTFKDLPEGATFNVEGVVFKISYVGGSGNDVILTVLETPEAAPNTGFMLLSANPVATMAIAVACTAIIVVIGRKYGNLAKLR